MEPHLLATLYEISVELDRRRIPWALVGGLAVSLRAEPRTTRDVDVMVMMADSDADALILSLRRQGYKETPGGVKVNRDTHELKLVSLKKRVESSMEGATPTVDILFSMTGIEHEVVTQAERLDLSTFSPPVASVAHLLALKVLAGRRRDLGDIYQLLTVAEKRDLHLARQALELISRRGFDEGKDIRIHFEEYLQRFREGTL